MTSPDRATFRLIPFASSAAFILLAALAFLAAGGPDASAQTGMATADVCPMDQGPDSLTDFARKCDVAVGETVPSFNCDDGTPVPENHLTGTYPAAFCDAPNVLHGVCDPGSRFQVLKETNTAAIVAHCRKQGNAPHVYGDIAVIQYNKSNGAICFYQALGLLPAAVSAPSDGNGPGKFPWFDPPHTAARVCSHLVSRTDWYQKTFASIRRGTIRFSSATGGHQPQWTGHLDHSGMSGSIGWELAFLNA